MTLQPGDSTVSVSESNSVKLFESSEDSRLGNKIEHKLDVYLDWEYA